MISVRFGIRLAWPIANAAIFVFKVRENNFEKLNGAVAVIRSLLAANGQSQIAQSIVFEQR